MVARVPQGPIVDFGGRLECLVSEFARKSGGVVVPFINGFSYSSVRGDVHDPDLLQEIPEDTSVILCLGILSEMTKRQAIDFIISLMDLSPHVIVSFPYDQNWEYGSLQKLDLVGESIVKFGFYHDDDGHGGLYHLSRELPSGPG